VAAGVEFLHHQTPPIIHMDLKSGNIVLTESLVPKVCDLGIGFSSLHAPSLGQLGSPAFMAPECAREEPIDNDKLPAVDCYGFGWVAHDCAHVNTDAGAAARLRAAGVEPSAAAAPPSSSSSSGSAATTANNDSATLLRSSATATAAAGTGTGTSTPWMGVLVRRELGGFAVDVDARVPLPLAQLVAECLAVEPDARPTLAAARARLAAAALDAPGWA